MWRGHVYQKIYSMKNLFCAGIRMGPDVKWYGNVGRGLGSGWGGDGGVWVKRLKFTTFQSGKITILKLKLEGKNKNIKILFMLNSCFVPKVLVTHTIFT